MGDRAAQATAVAVLERCMQAVEEFADVSPDDFPDFIAGAWSLWAGAFATMMPSFDEFRIEPVRDAFRGQQADVSDELVRSYAHAWLRKQALSLARAAESWLFDCLRMSPHPATLDAFRVVVAAHWHADEALAFRPLHALWLLDRADSTALIEEVATSPDAPAELAGELRQLLAQAGPPPGGPALVAAGSRARDPRPQRGARVESPSDDDEEWSIASDDFPIGERLADGAFEIVELVRGSVERGQYRARGSKQAGSAGTYLVTVGPRQRRSEEELRKSLALDVPGVTPLVALCTVRHPAGGDYSVLVEQEPTGSPSDLLPLPLDLRDAARLALDVLESLGPTRALGGLRPELVYVVEREGGHEVSGIT